MQTAEASAPPQILGQPQNQVVGPGEAASFSVVVADTRGLTYQWRFNGAGIGGANGDAFLLQNVGATNEGQYSVVLVNGSGSVTSAPAMLWFDGNGNGLPDTWEMTYFGNLNQTAAGDFDGDGVSNLQEFLDGTNPTDRSSALYRLTVLADGGSVSISPNLTAYTNGQTVTLTASPSNTFRAWTGDLFTPSNTVTLAMTNNRTLLAHFGALNFTWTNAAGGDWNNPTNWSPNLVPGSNDNASITLSVSVTVSNDTDCGGLTLGDLNSYPTLTGAGTLTLHGSSLWSDGNMNGSGRTVIAPEGTMTLANAGSLGLITRTLENAGYIVWTYVGSGDLTLYSGAVITNRPGAIMEIQVRTTISYGSGTAARFDNAGAFIKSLDPGTCAIGSLVNFNNYGTVTVDSGTLQLSGNFINTGLVSISAGTFMCNGPGLLINGAVTLSPGTTCLMAGTGSGGGTFTAPPTALVNFSAGIFTLNPGVQLNGDGLYEVSGSATLTVNTNVSIENLNLSATLTGTGIVTVSNLLTWAGGAMTGTGTTLVAPGATLDLNATGVTLDRTLENSGYILCTDNGSISGNGGVITNDAGALFEVQNNSAFTQSGSACRFNNAGTFRRSVSAGTNSFGPAFAFNNYGTMDIQTGTVLFNNSFLNNGAVTLSAGATNRLAAGGSASGTFSGAPGALVDFNSGIFTLNPGAQLNDAGLYRINGGTLTCNTDIAVTNLDLPSGTLGGTGIVTVNNVMNWTGGTMNGSGRTVIAPSATLNLGNTSGVNLFTRTLENAGTVLWTGSADLVGSSAVITNRAGALFDVQNDATFNYSLSGGRFDNAGTFRKDTGTGTTTFSAAFAFNNYGAVNIQTGTLLCNYSFLNNGSVTLSAGTTNRVAGSGSATGSFSVPLTALVDWSAGTFTLNPGAQLNGGGLYQVDGSAQLTVNTNVSLQNLNLAATLAGTGNITVGNVLNWTGGSMTGSGRTLIAPGGTLNVSAASAVGLNCTLENAGSAICTGAGIFGSGGVITNRAGALFDVQANASFTHTLGGCRFDNAGTFRKSVSTGTNTFDNAFPFNNYGTVDLRNGILAANASYTSSSGALLNYAIGGTIPGANYGRVQVLSSVTLNGTLTVVLTNGYLPTTNDAFTVLTAGTRNGSFASFSYPSSQVTMQLSNTATSVIVRVTSVAAPPPPPLLLPPLVSTSNVLLTWTAISNTTYRVEFNPNLTPSNWNALPGDVLGASNTASKLDALTPSNRLYRVRVIP